MRFIYVILTDTSSTLPWLVWNKHELCRWASIFP